MPKANLGLIAAWSEGQFFDRPNGLTDGGRSCPLTLSFRCSRRTCAVPDRPLDG